MDKGGGSGVVRKKSGLIDGDEVRDNVEFYTEVCAGVNRQLNECTKPDFYNITIWRIIIIYETTVRDRMKVGIEIHFLLLQLFHVDSNCWGGVISLATVAEMCTVLRSCCGSIR